MIRNTIKIACMALLSASVALVPSFAEEPAGDTRYSGEVEIGVQGIDGATESSKFQEYREIPSGFYLGAFRFGIDREQWFADFEALDISQDDQRISARIGKPGKFRIDLEYDETPSWISNTASTLFVRQSGGDLIFPFPLRALHEAFAADPMTTSLVAPSLQAALDASQPIFLGWKRSRTSADARWNISPEWTFTGGVKSSRREGTKPLSIGPSSPGGDIVELAQPLDEQTLEARVGLEFARKRYNFGVSLVHSEYENDLQSRNGDSLYSDALIVDNPLRVTDAISGNNGSAGRFLFTLPPDNSATWINLDGGVAIGDWGRVAAQLSMGQNKQDERFQPFSSNTIGSLQTTTIPDPNDPMAPPITVPVEVRRGGLYGPTVSGFDGGGSYDGQVDTRVYDLRFTGRPVRWMNFKIQAHGYDYDTQTPEYVVTDYVRADTAKFGRARAALPFAWKRDDLGADVRFRPVREIAFDLGYKQEKWDREFRAVEETTEDIYNAGVDWTPTSAISLRANWSHGERDYEEYNEETLFGEESYPAGEPVANAIVLEQRLYDLANRDRDRYDVLARFSAGERVELGLSFSRIDDDYDTTTEVEHSGMEETRDTLGRLADQTRGWTFDIGILASDRVTISADYGREQFEYDLASRYRPVTANVAIDDPLNNWFTFVSDETESYGIGLDADLVPGRWTLALSARVADATGESDSFGVPGGVSQGEAESFPDVTNRLVEVLTGVRWQVTDAFRLGFEYLHESYDAHDFARDGMQPWMGAVDSGVTESVYLGWRVPNYDVDLFRVLASYRF